MSPQPHEAEALVDAAAKALSLPIEPALRPQVAEALRGILGLAQLVMQFPLRQDVESAQVFRQ